jgi:hypothetical protein
MAEKITDKEQISQLFDGFIETLITAYDIPNVDIEVAAEFLVDKFDILVNHDQIKRLSNLIAQAQKNYYDNLTKVGFSNSEAMSVLCSMIGKQTFNKKK